MVSFIQPSFAKGELSPDMYGRVDAAAYQVGFKTARNIIIHLLGGASNKPGSYVIGPVKTHSTTAPRLFPFQFRTSDQYVLEVGNLYIRVIRNDAHVVNSAVTITAATAANPIVVTAGSHGYSNGDEVFITGVVGMTQLNGRRFIVANKNANDFELTHQVTGNNINGIDYTAYASAGTVASVFELTTPYVTADLNELKIVQSADVVTITHPTYAPRDLARTDHNSWTLTVNTYAPGQADPAGVTVAQQGTSGSKVHRYRVTAIRQEEDIFEESLPGINTTSKTVASATLANPVRCTATAHGYVTGDEVELSAMDEMTALNGRRFFITKIDNDTFDLDDEDGTDTDVYPTAETTGGIANATFYEITDSITEALTIIANFNRITWTAASGANRYAIYRRESGRYGLIGEVDAPLTTFDDVTASVDTAGAIWAVDLTIGPPRARNPFRLADTFPAASSYYQQRQVYGGSNNASDSHFYSQTGNRLNMSVSQPTQADDALTFTLNARDVNPIRHFVPGTDLIIFTVAGEWRINAGDNSGFSTTTLSQKPQSEYGSGHHRPIVVGDLIIFAEDDNATIRSLGYSLEPDKYIGEKLNLLADHLLAEEGPTKHTISDWAFVFSPEPRLYIARSDGKMLTMTFSKTHQVVAWTTWDTPASGQYERLITLRKSISSAEDGLYAVVRRILVDGDGNRQTVRYIERTASRKFGDIREAHFFDFGFEVDVPLTITGATVANPTVITAASHGFSNGDDVDIAGIVWVVDALDENGNEVQPTQLNDRRYTVVSAATNTFELADSVGIRIEGATVADPVVITSADHGLSDGDAVYISDVVGMTEINDTLFRVSNPTDDTFKLQNVTTGAPINGLGYTAWIANGTAKLRVDGSAHAVYDSGGEARVMFTTVTGLWEWEGIEVGAVADGAVVAFASTAEGRVTNGQITLPSPASRVHGGLSYVSDIETLSVEVARGTIQGAMTRMSHAMVRFKKSILPRVGPDKNHLVQMKQRKNEEMGSPTVLFTGDVKQALPPSWNGNGRFFMRQIDPMPFTVTAIVPDLDIEDRGDGND